MEDFDRCYRAVQARDARFDGWFFTAVSSTGIYCRPSCPARTPLRKNVSFYATAAAAQQAGFRACLRCRPDAAPGSPEWMGRADVAARAVRLILDGIIDREGVVGLARTLGYSERHLTRLLMAEIGTGPLALARAQRAQTARILLQTTGIPITDVAFGAGFTSVRQFNETIRAVFGRTPTALRKQDGSPSGTDLAGGGAISVRLAHRLPFAAEPLYDYLGRRAVPGLENYDGSVYSRSLALPGGGGSVALEAQSAKAGEIRAIFQLDELRDLRTAISRCRRLLNLDADPVAVDDAFSADPLLRGLVRKTPGVRVAGAADGFELAVRAIIGQQASVAGARSILGRLVRATGEPLQNPLGNVTHRFPTPGALTSAARRWPQAFPMPTVRRLTIAALAEAVAEEEITINPGTDSEELQRKLARLPGVGPWTASYVAMRALGDPDAFPATDLRVRRAIERLGAPSDLRSIETITERWRPWRAYAAAHLWLADLPA